MVLWRSQDELGDPGWRRALLGLYLVALLARMPGLLWGDFHPDENVSMSARALAGELVPNQHFYPPLLNYLNALAFAAMFLAGRLVGVWSSLPEFRAQYFADPAPFYFAARFVTASIGAAAAPVAAAIAQQLGLRRGLAPLVGVAVALLPVHILLSHLSKSDVAMVTALLGSVYFWLARLERAGFAGTRRPWGRTQEDLLFGFFVALTLSFKHSSIFLVAPLAVALLAELWRRGEDPGRLARSAARIAGVAALSWSVMNVGILLDFSGFLQFQMVQSQLARRSPGVAETIRSFLAIEWDPTFGPTFFGFLLFLLVPWISHGAPTRWLWGCIAGALVIVLSIAGNRLRMELLLPYHTLMLVLGTTVALSLPRAPRWLHASKWTTVGALIVLCAWHAGRVDQQALRPSGKQQVAAFLQKELRRDPTAKILSGTDLRNHIAVSPRAEEDVRARHERLAQRYGVDLPPAAPDRAATRVADGRDYYVHEFPWVIGGLEVYDEDEVEVVVPFAWPLQQREWTLSYWLDRGFRYFVTKNEERYLAVDVPAYASFHLQIREMCLALAEFPTRRPLFWEEDLKVYRCDETDAD